MPEARAALASLAAGEQPLMDAANGEIRLAVANPAASAEAVRRLDAQRLAILAVEVQQPSPNLAFAYVFSWISAFIGLSLRGPETVESAGLIWVFRLVFASSAFVATSSMPGIVHTFADINPVTLTVNAARALTIGHGPALAPALGTLAWLVGLLLEFARGAGGGLEPMDRCEQAGV